MAMSTSNVSTAPQGQRKSGNENIQAYVRVRPLNDRERALRSCHVVDVMSSREIITRHSADTKLTKKFTFDRAFGPDSRQVDVYTIVVAPLIEEVLSGYNCTVFAYGQTGTGKTHTMVGTECAELKSSWEDDSDIGIIPRALSHLFDELRLMEVEFSMRISYLELYNEELCDLLSTDDTVKIRIFDDATKKGSVIIQGLEEIPVHSKDDVYKLLEKGKDRRRTAKTLMNAQSSRSHTVFSIVVHIRENGIDGEEMLKIGKLNLVDLAGSENAMKAGNEGMRVRETASINQSLLTLGRVITALVERTPHIPYRESKLTRLLQESLGGRTKTSIIATVSPGHKDIEETLSTLLYADRAKNIQNKPEANQKLTKRTMLKEYTEEIDKLKRDLNAAREKNGIYLPQEAYIELTSKVDAQNRELNEKVLLLKALKDEMQNKERLFSELSLNLVDKTTKLERVEKHLEQTKGALFQTKKVLNTTKRRCKEKKTLLECRVKTEKVLTEQATQILEVADVATSETHQLHSAIERRRDVDKQNQMTCQNFTERMRENFNILNNQFEKMRKAHKPKVDMVNQELGSAIKTQDILLNNSKSMINELQQSLNDFSIESATLEGKFSNVLKEISLEHKDEILKLLSDQKSHMLNQKEIIEKSCSELVGNNAAQANIAKDLKEKSLNAYQECFNDMQNFADHLHDDMSKCVLTLKDFIDVTMKLRNQIHEEYAIIEEERQIRERERENRLKRMAQTEEYLRKLETTSSQYEMHLSKTEKSTTTFCNEQETRKNQFIPEINQKFDEFLSINLKNNLEGNRAQGKNSSFYVENIKQIDATIECSNKNYERIVKSAHANQAIITSRQDEHLALLANSCAAIDEEVNEHTKETVEQLTCASSFNMDLERCVNEYGIEHKDQLERCAFDVERLKKQEIKTYASTGATPSKKVFNYPRVLAATSPDNKIIKRLRQENAGSDLDTTAETIDEEENFIEEQTENLSINMENASGIILNSTTHTPVLHNSKNILKSISPNNTVLKEKNSEKENWVASSM